MATEATTFSGNIRGQDAAYKTFTKRNSLHRFRHLIEHSDWDEAMFAWEKWVDRLCIGIIIVASLYFIPSVLGILFLR